MAGGMTDAHLPGMQSGFPISLGAANPKSVPKSVPETLERPVITLDEVQAIRAEQKPAKGKTWASVSPEVTHGS